MNDESDYDSESEADTGPMPIPVDELEQKPVRLQVLEGAGAVNVGEGAVTVPGGVINISGKALRGAWTVLKPSGDGNGR